MISRVADHCLWFGRYLERAESTARVLTATRHLALDAELTARQCWLPVIIVSGEEETFAAQFGEDGAEDGETVEEYMAWQDDNGVSIRRSIAAARENARSIREVLSAEAWQAINELHLWISSHEARDTWKHDRDAFYRKVRDATLFALGAVRSTMLHDEPLDFIWLGVLLERVSQTARILDVHYHTVAQRQSYFDPIPPGGAQQVVDTAVWVALLRACSGLEPFMQRAQGRVTSIAVARFLIQEPRHPRAIRYCVHGAYVRLSRIRPPERRDLPGGHTLERLRALDEWLATQPDDALEGEEIHHILTHCVDETAAICAGLGRELLGYASPEQLQQ
jgi:uncharacterized alpha-E superfamily protein